MPAKRSATVAAATPSDEDQVSAKRWSFIKEKNAYPISIKKAAYESVEVSESNFIVRTTAEANFNSFGVRGQENVAKAFYAMLTLLERHRELFISKCKYGAKELVALLASISEEDRARMEQLSVIDGTTVSISGEARAQLSNSDIPQISLFKVSGNDSEGEQEIRAGIYLFANELVKLIKYLNSTHGISSTVLSKNPPLPYLSDLDLLC